MLSISAMPVYRGGAIFFAAIFSNSSFASPIPPDPDLALPVKIDVFFFFPYLW